MKKNENKLKAQKLKFKEHLCETFIPVSIKTQKEMEQSQNTRNIEDSNYLKIMKTTRKGVLGQKDKKLLLAKKDY